MRRRAPRWSWEQFTITYPEYRKNVPSEWMAKQCLENKLIAPADLIDGTHAARLLHDAGIIQLEDEVFKNAPEAKTLYEEELHKASVQKL